MSARRHADRSPQLLAYTAVTIVLGLAAVVWSIATFPIDPAISLTAHADREGILLGLVFWIGLALFGGTRVHRLHGHGTLTFHLPFIVAAMALGGPTAGALVALIGTIERRELDGEVPWYGGLSNHAHLALGAVIGGVVLLGSEAALRASLGDGPEVVLASLVIGSLVFGVVAAALAEGTIILRDRLTLHEATRYFNTTFRLTAAAEVVVGWILVLTYTSVGWWAALITAGLVLVIWQGYDAGERARHDPLTGLLSRAGYDVRVEEAIRAAERNARGFARHRLRPRRLRRHQQQARPRRRRRRHPRGRRAHPRRDPAERRGRPPRAATSTASCWPTSMMPTTPKSVARRILARVTAPMTIVGSLTARRRVVRRPHRRVRGGSPAARRYPPHDRRPDVSGQVLERGPQSARPARHAPSGARARSRSSGSPAPRSAEVDLTAR